MTGREARVVIYGPQGSGKTLHAERLRAHFQKTQVLDDWLPGDPLPGDALALTSQPDVPGAIALADALAAVEAAAPRPSAWQES